MITGPSKRFMSGVNRFFDSLFFLLIKIYFLSIL